MPDLSELEAAIGYTFLDQNFLIQALTHRSWVEEHRLIATPQESQQRLEFLGDAVLKFVMADHLFHADPAADEGTLTRRRDAVIKGEWLSEVGRRLNLRPFVRLGQGERLEGDRNKKLLEDTVEAVLGAVWLDGGLEAAAGLVRRWMPTDLDAAAVKDAISRLNEWHQARHRAPSPEPVFDTAGPDHAKTFVARWTVDGVTGTGSGSSKPEAKRKAAADLLSRLGA